jgi:hypothetical protein
MAPVPQVDQATPADLAARRLLEYHEQLRRMSAADLAAEIARLSALVASGNPPASPADALALAVALAQQHNPGDLARAASLLEPIAQVSQAQPQPWQPLARLLQARISEERRLEEELERQASQRRDTQRTIQQLTEKLEALKAIERSMTAHPAAGPPAGSAAAPGSEPAAPTPPRTP